MPIELSDVAALADLPPGPQLGAALAEIDPARVPNNDLLPLLAAQARQVNHEAARWPAGSPPANSWPGSAA